MSYDESDAAYEEGMSLLYEEFKQIYQDNFIYERIDSFYKENPNIVKAPIKNLADSRALFEKGFLTAAFLHAVISIEVGIKAVAIKPILYSLTINRNAGDLLYKHTFKQKSLQYIPKFYYQIVKDISGLDFRTIFRGDIESSIWDEWSVLQELRNKVVHQGVSVELIETKNAIDVASYVCNEIIPSILDRFSCHIEECIIQDGSREYMRKNIT